MKRRAEKKVSTSWPACRQIPLIKPSFSLRQVQCSLNPCMAFIGWTSAVRRCTKALTLRTRRTGRLVNWRPMKSSLALEKLHGIPTPNASQASGSMVADHWVDIGHGWIREESVVTSGMMELGGTWSMTSVSGMRQWPSSTSWFVCPWAVLWPILWAWKAYSRHMWRSRCLHGSMVWAWRKQYGVGIVWQPLDLHGCEHWSDLFSSLMWSKQSSAWEQVLGVTILFWQVVWSATIPCYKSWMAMEIAPSTGRITWPTSTTGRLAKRQTLLMHIIAPSTVQQGQWSWDACRSFKYTLQTNAFKVLVGDGGSLQEWKMLGRLVHVAKNSPKHRKKTTSFTIAMEGSRKHPCFLNPNKDFMVKPTKGFPIIACIACTKALSSKNPALMRAASSVAKSFAVCGTLGPNRGTGGWWRSNGNPPKMEKPSFKPAMHTLRLEVREVGSSGSCGFLILKGNFLMKGPETTTKPPKKGF